MRNEHTWSMWNCRRDSCITPYTSYEVHKAVYSRQIHFREDGKEFLVTRVACGDYHTLWTDENDQIYSCGLGKEGNAENYCKMPIGQLGHGDRSSQKYPKLIEYLREKKIVKLASGGGFSSAHSVAVTCMKVYVVGVLIIE